MNQDHVESFGILPSLEVLPLFTSGFRDCLAGQPLPPHLKAFSSYGEISRNLLTGKLCGGIIPWEIFITDVHALPGQRDKWKVPLFLNPCPTELVLREPIYRAFYPTQPNTQVKLPSNLTIGVESQNSLTKSQTRDWLGLWSKGHQIDLTFKMLPIDLMVHALEAEALDAIIAPSPWGIHAESNGLGKRDPQFKPGKFAQQLVVVLHQRFLERHPAFVKSIAPQISAARCQLQSPAVFLEAIEQMTRSGKPLVQAEPLQLAARLHSFDSLNQDVVPDLQKIISELMCLNDFSALPGQVSPSEQTARLLLPVDSSY